MKKNENLMIKFTKSLLGERTISLDDLAGKHLLSGVEYDVPGKFEANHYGMTLNNIGFILDDVLFIAIEDSNDGYRSMLDRLVLDFDLSKIKNRFNPIDVVCVIDDDVLSIIDIANGQVVLRVGTDFTDSYYPMFIQLWMPENLSINN